MKSLSAEIILANPTMYCYIELLNLGYVRNSDTYTLHCDLRIVNYALFRV